MIQRQAHTCCCSKAHRLHADRLLERLPTALSEVGMGGNKARVARQVRGGRAPRPVS
jgi:hypothetical protein